MKTRSTSASRSLKGQDTEPTTVKWPNYFSLFESQVHLESNFAPCVIRFCFVLFVTLFFTFFFSQTKQTELDNYFRLYQKHRFFYLANSSVTVP